MTRIDRVRAATDTAKDSVTHAAEVVAPYAGTAKENAAHYAQEARTRLAPKVSHAAHTARDQYGAHLQPRIENARGALPPKVDAAASRAAQRARKTVRQAADYTVPRVEHAVAEARAAAEPVIGEAVERGSAASAALRGRVTAAEIDKLVKKRTRRTRRGTFAKRLTVLSVVAGGAYAAWKWWDRQANPDWLVEPPVATEVPGRAPLSSVDGSADRAVLDPEVQAKQAEHEAEAEGSKKPDENR
ncbi:DUF5324 family protein [Streptomyces sp. H27-D2]|uniref:DUF5324 family protein n=1 Tax=Streptomyces sp. H27-D2 TaxID=3046304 RepID=UPI002DBB9077|nr:DUF5324 family protein [Streptomyces sp. H27-D2]MEC4017415.1 DUF5324 family protein [Streptomyces sp. H27-D2]